MVAGQLPAVVASAAVCSFLNVTTASERVHDKTAAAASKRNLG